MAENYHDQEFIEYVVKNLVDKPEGVVVKRTVDEMGVLLELTVDKEDMGVVIGKEGRTAKALRTLLRVLGAKSDSRINLKIVDPEGSEPRPEKAEDKKGKVKKEVKESAPDVAEEAPVAEKVEEAPEPEDDERPMADLDI